jgi:23S rRNA (guanosine2251-2'-O)-methyltransferase
LHIRKLVIELMKYQSSLIFGTHAVIEAIRSGKEIEKLILKKDLSGEPLREILKASRERNIPYQFVPIEKLDRITQKNHQGVIAYIAEIEYQKLEQVIPFLYEQGKAPFILILDHITDVRNFGSIARTAECAGVDAIVIPEKGAAQINADAIKTSSGALHSINVCREISLIKAIQFLSDSGLKIVAASEKGTDYYTQPDYSGPVAIVMGAEDTGISNDIIRKADSIVKIPLHGKVSSLNVAVATGLVLYEVVKQRIN